MSEAVNTLIRRGLLPSLPRRAFRQRTASIGVRVDVSNVADALAALCIEHGLAIVSADSDFARFDEIEWINPTAAR